MQEKPLSHTRRCLRRSALRGRLHTAAGRRPAAAALHLCLRHLHRQGTKRPRVLTREACGSYVLESHYATFKNGLPPHQEPLRRPGHDAHSEDHSILGTRVHQGSAAPDLWELLWAVFGMKQEPPPTYAEVYLHCIPDQPHCRPPPEIRSLGIACQT